MPVKKPNKLQTARFRELAQPQSSTGSGIGKRKTGSGRPRGRPKKVDTMQTAPTSSVDNRDPTSSGDANAGSSLEAEIEESIENVEILRGKVPAAEGQLSLEFDFEGLGQYVDSMAMGNDIPDLSPADNPAAVQPEGVHGGGADLPDSPSGASSAEKSMEAGLLPYGLGICLAAAAVAG
ncbi:hypothetical protein BCR39DRAFT_562361 [Naematelia encephala]|uniref:Uncharacterized protein n=1 Tax=Naematelia encephala TaxID=71784 RepID=A0A1Y2AIG2_9TREE|nr:hypothetical protein BCR39DRAFT_562361 [Naematelia encephala]